MSGTLIRNSKLRWDMYLNYSRNRNKLVAFPGIENTVYAGQLIVGRPLNTRYVTHYLGVDPLTGNYVFRRQEWRWESNDQPFSTARHR